MSTNLIESKNNNQTSFTYVIIPSDISKPILEKQGNTNGGLLNDELLKNAKEYFSLQHNEILKSVNDIENASEEERKALLNSLRAQIKDNKNVSNNNIDDASLIQMIKASCEATTVEILALTIPMKDNNYEGISMYISPNSSKSSTTNEPMNERATALMCACNYQGNGGTMDNYNKDSEALILHGDVFIGRYHDNEMEDIWIRKDFTTKDTSINSTWCTVASSIRKNTQGNTNANIAQLMNTKKEEKELSCDNYKWVQNEDEVEIKFILNSNIATKDIDVKFLKSKITVKICETILLQGETANDYIIDESTYTIQSIGNDQRELCVILAKKDCNCWWDCVIKK